MHDDFFDLDRFLDTADEAGDIDKELAQLDARLKTKEEPEEPDEFEAELLDLNWDD